MATRYSPQILKPAEDRDRVRHRGSDTLIPIFSELAILDFNMICREAK